MKESVLVMDKCVVPLAIRGGKALLAKNFCSPKNERKIALCTEKLKGVSPEFKSQNSLDSWEDQCAVVRLAAVQLHCFKPLLGRLPTVQDEPIICAQYQQYIDCLESKLHATRPDDLQFISVEVDSAKVRSPLRVFSLYYQIK